MALQLNPEPLVLADDLAAEPQHTLRQAVELKTAQSDMSAAESNETTPRLAVLLSVPRVSIADPVVATKTEPAVTLAIADKPADEPIVAETFIAEDTGEDVALAEPNHKSLEVARDFIESAKSRIHSIDWVKAGQWAKRPVVTYSSAVVLLVAIIVAIVARPRDPNSTEDSAAAAVAETHDEHLGHAESHIADSHRTEQTESSGLPNPSDAIAKLPPTSPVGNRDESHVLPWRREDTSGFTATPGDGPAARTADSNIHRHGTVPFPPTRSAAHSSTGSHVHPSVRPNVARLEGRIHTPKLSR
jgi:hypothetical protein